MSRPRKACALQNSFAVRVDSRKLQVVKNGSADSMRVAGAICASAEIAGFGRLRHYRANLPE
jgi:hypothetical protein